MIAPLALVLALHAHAICLRDHPAQVSGPITWTWTQQRTSQQPLYECGNGAMTVVIIRHGVTTVFCDGMKPWVVKRQPKRRAQPERPSIDTARADRFIAANPCTAHWTHGEHAIGPAPEPWTILRCVVPPVPDPVEMRGAWYRLTADGWDRNDEPGVWTPIVGEP